MPTQLSEEEALAEGAEILGRRKERLRIEAELRKRMGHSMIKEWHFWFGFALGFLSLFYPGSSSPPSSSLDFLRWLPAVLFILMSLESAAMKREKALLDWLEYQKTREPQN